MDRMGQFGIRYIINLTPSYTSVLFIYVKPSSLSMVDWNSLGPSFLYKVSHNLDMVYTDGPRNSSGIIRRNQFIV